LWLLFFFRYLYSQSRDYVLEEGDALLVTLPGLVLIRALAPARIGYTESVVPMPFKGCFSQIVFN
jgi:hypothetical protein